jgi:hypothetical protein
VFGEIWGLRVSGDEALDGLGHELGKVVFDPA